MNPSSADRHQLYNGLSDILGPEQADTLMAYLPTDPDLVTRSDFDLLSTSLRDVEHGLRAEIGQLRTELKGEIGQLKGEMGQLRTDLKGEMGQLRTALASTNQRLDRMFLTLVGGLIVFGATLVASAFFGPL